MADAVARFTDAAKELGFTAQVVTMFQPTRPLEAKAYLGLHLQRRARERPRADDTAPRLAP